MHSTRKSLWTVLFLLPLILSIGVFGYEVDDDIPEVTARVARISFIQGDVQIRRNGSQDWERVTQNLPIVEGDEIATEAESRLEIQFSSYSHLRLAENSILKIVNLKDEGIAVSLPQGTLSVRVSEFDKDRSYFEIDAPKTTIAIQMAGMYRVDAGEKDETEVRVSATDGGEARVYADNSGFTLKNGRSAKVYIEGNLAGEWDTEDAARYADEFDSWALERDSIIAKRLKDAYYDKYYDRDIYGAEDLNENGEWIHTRKYGYVWRPYRDSISRYADWSPYRYGHWRWVPPYGWTWVNDEPWGWATYHHGRWFYDDGYWYWTPYGYYRHSRSWWSPALVVINIWGGNVCWYPLPYHYSYYNYNSYYYSHYGWGNHHNNNQGGGGGTPVATPTPVTLTPLGVNPRTRNPNVGPLGQVPPSGVVMVKAGEFGTMTKGIRTAPLALAKTVLSKAPDYKQPTVLPAYKDLSSKVSQQIRVPQPQIIKSEVQVKTGAAERKQAGSIDGELQKTRIFGNRAPLQINTSQGEIKTTPDVNQGPRKTGAVERPVSKQPDSNSPIRQAPTPTKRRDEPVKQDPQYLPPPPKQRDEPQQNEPVKQPRYDPPPTKQEQPRYDPPPKSEPPPRNDPPPSKSEPPPSKSEPSKPSPPSESKSGGKNKDG